MARKTQQLGRQVQPLAHLRIVGVQSGLQQVFGHGTVAIKPEMLFGKTIDQGIRHAQRLSDIADSAARTVGDHGGGNGGALATVLGVDVLDDFFAPVVLKVHVDVGRLVAGAADKALEQQIGMLGIDLGHAQAVTDRRIGGRAATLAQDVSAAGKAHDVMHGQKIHLVVEVCNQRQLVVHLLVHCRRQALRVTRARALLRELAQGLCRCQARQHGLQRVLVAQLVQTEVAARRHHQCVGQQRGRVKLPQPQARTQMGFGVGLQCKAALTHRSPQAHGGDHVLQRLARAHVHVHVAAGDQRHTGQPRYARQRVPPQIIVQTLQQLQGQPQS